MSLFKCKMCGGTLKINDKQTVATCDYCGTPQTVPKLYDDKITNMLERADQFRRGKDFDRAAEIYEEIIREKNDDAEIYWLMVLCRYGIEYVEDPKSHERIPTVNRAQFTSIYDDADYQSAIRYADMLQKILYEKEAATINEIQKGILAISNQEEPYDVFICYKETDENGERTHDSVYANELYYELTELGYKVFFSRITLEDKLGTAYEPYIFAALNSAKVMVVLGTKPEHFNAVWVKNEWSRYLTLMNKSRGKKILIPAYRDMNPYDLPEEFSHLQAQDMSKLGFMQDLIRGIKKIVKKNEVRATPPVKETVVTSANSTVAPLLKRIFMFLEDGDWESADEYCEKVLDIDPENTQAYIGQLMAKLNCKFKQDLKTTSQSFQNSPLINKAIRFATAEEKIEINEYLEANKKVLERLRIEFEEKTRREKAEAEERRRLEEEQRRIEEEQRRIKEKKRRAEAKEAQRKAEISSKGKEAFDLTKAVRSIERDINACNDNIKNCESKIKKDISRTKIIRVMSWIIMFPPLMIMVIGEAFGDLMYEWESSIAFAVVLLLLEAIAFYILLKLRNGGWITSFFAMLGSLYLLCVPTSIYAIYVLVKTRKYAGEEFDIKNLNNYKNQLIELNSKLKNTNNEIKKINSEIHNLQSLNYSEEN